MAADEQEPADAQEILGEGARGTVYKVWDRDLRRFVAKKILRADLASDASAARGIVEEAQIMGQLGHPGIVPVHRVDVAMDGRVFFTMDLVRGPSLEVAIDSIHQGGGEAAAGEPIGTERTLAGVLSVLERVCDAVGFAHDKGLVHGALEPSALRVGRFGEAYVMSWGSGSHGGRNTVYSAPEQSGVPGEPRAPTADVYSLGAILYHAVAGRPPLSSNPVGARSIGLPRKAPAALVSIVRKALAQAPADRYPTALALGDDLRAFLEQRVVVAHRTGAVAELTHWVRRNTLVAAALGVALVGLVGALVWSGVERDRAEANARTAEEARDRATREAARGVRNFQAAFGGGQALVDAVLSPKLRGLPGSKPVLASLGAKAAESMESLIDLGRDDAQARLRTAQAFLKLCHLRKHLGDWGGAVAAGRDAAARFENARRYFDSVAAPGTAGAWMPIFDHERRLALRQELLSRAMMPGVDEAARQADGRRLLAQMRAAAPESQQISGDLPFLAYDNLGGMLFHLAGPLLRQGEVQDATRLQEESVLVAERAVAHHADELLAWELLGNCRYALARNLRSKKRDDPEARKRMLECYAGAADAAKQGLALAPGNMDLLELQGRSCFDLASEHTLWTSDAVARPLFVRAIDVLGTLAADHPTHGRARLNLGGARCNFAALLHRDGASADGARMAAAGVTPLVEAMALGVPAAEGYLGNTFRRSAILWNLAGDPAKAAVQARSMTQALPGVRAVESAARILADCAVVAQEPEDSQGGYFAEAVAMLRRAVEMGHVMPDAAGTRYANFRGVPGFAELLRPR